jgi:ParB/RepB/Spo0J family partition protein
VVVRRHGAGYELIAGHRRVEAAKVLGWTSIPAIVRHESDDQAYILTLVENLQREDLSPKEEAAALEVLVRERGWSTRQVGEAIKRSAMYVSKRLRVFETRSTSSAKRSLSTAGTGAPDVSRMSSAAPSTRTASRSWLLAVTATRPSNDSAM